MAHFKVNERDIFFILKDQLNYGSLCQLERYKGLDEETLDMLVTEAIKFAQGVQEIGEKKGVQFEGGQVKCPSEFRETYRLFGENGWIAVARDTTYGGQGFPLMMRIVVNDQMYGASQSFNIAASLTHGAGHLIESYGAEDLRQLFVPKMYGGQWSGTMALTEPNAGSNLGGIRTVAYRDGDYFKIKGTKQKSLFGRGI